eukprot:3259897-Alexandrium_andersonii.AAC.1
MPRRHPHACPCVIFARARVIHTYACVIHTYAVSGNSAHASWMVICCSTLCQETPLMHHGWLFAAPAPQSTCCSAKPVPAPARTHAVPPVAS